MKYSLLPVAKRLVDLLINKIYFANDIIGPESKEKAKNLKAGEILLLENIRFLRGEEKNDPEVAKELASMADIYVNDAFGTAHRKHASIVGVPKLLPNAVGYLMGKEVNTILSTLEKPERPFVAILGGAKVSDKINVVSNLAKKVDVICVGGGMAYTFLKAQGVNVGQSMVDDTKLELAKQILLDAETRGVKILLPIDNLCASVFSPTAKPVKVKGDIPNNLMGLDIGPKTIRLFKNEIKKAKTVVWNGPLGVFEFENFCKGTEKIAKAVSKIKGRSIVGGGDSIAAIHRLGKAKKISHISTGGGASLKMLEGEILPGVEVIDNI